MAPSPSPTKSRRRQPCVVIWKRALTTLHSTLKGGCILLAFLVGHSALAQQECPLIAVSGISSASHDVVLGSDGQDVVLLRQPTQGSGIGTAAQMFVATLDGDPRAVSIPKSIAVVPEQHEAWASLGRLLHVDIDPSSGMAVISAEKNGHHSVWFSALNKNGAWSSPWPVPALETHGGEAIFAMFDVRDDRLGDVLCGFKPEHTATGWNEEGKGEWKGGFDIVRIPRRGDYRSIWFLEALNSTADEWALAPHPVRGGWLSAERLKGRGGIDVWWCAEVPLEDGMPTLTGVFLEGHTLTVNCGSRPISGLNWRVKDAKTGSALARLSTDETGTIRLDKLRSDGHFVWSVENVPTCGQAQAIWKDKKGRVIQRFTLMGKSWTLNMLAAMTVGTWRVRPVDRSALPVLTSSHGSAETADWVVFHSVGSPLLPEPDLRRLKAWAIQWTSRPQASGHVLVMGHASADGDPEANRRLADERARQVAVQLEFAGLTPDQIRVEGWGADRPLLRCPSGVNCPSGQRERSRRTELYLVQD